MKKNVEQAAMNTDKELWRQPTTDNGPEDGTDSGMEPYVFVTKQGGIGFNHYGDCAVRSIGEWVKLAYAKRHQSKQAGWEKGFNDKFMEYALENDDTLLDPDTDSEDVKAFIRAEIEKAKVEELDKAISACRDEYNNLIPDPSVIEAKLEQLKERV